jgi:hypothetical protein
MQKKKKEKKLREKKKSWFSMASLCQQKGKELIDLLYLFLLTLTQ